MFLMFIANKKMQMDSIFLLNEVERSNFLQQLTQSFSCTYICLWSYIPQSPYNCLLFMDGHYHEQKNTAISSSISFSQRLFDEYIKSIFMIDNGRVPGLAFKNNLPFLELYELNLQSLASNRVQLQFYQETRIKKAIFLGCKTGEIELGFSVETQVNMELEMKNLFPEDFSRPVHPQQLDQNRPSSSSSSLRSLSMESPESSPFLFNIPNTSNLQESSTGKHVVQQTMRPTSTTIVTPPIQQAIQSLSQIRNIQFPTIVSENDEITKAILAVISSSSPSSSTSSHPQPQKPSAFKRYTCALGPTMQITRKQNILKRAIKFFSGLALRRNQEQTLQGSNARPSSTQLHHMISERRRREKLNESFQALRSLLPQGTKRDKASVLTSTTEYITSLKTQVEELTQRNRILEAKLPQKQPIDVQGAIGTSSDRIHVEITDVDIGESTSNARIVDLQVIVRGECNMLDLVIRVMEFLKQDENVSLISIEAQPLMVNTNSINRIVLRLKIDQEADWDRSGFQEAVKRVVADLAQ